MENRMAIILDPQPDANSGVSYIGQHKAMKAYEEPCTRCGVVLRQSKFYRPVLCLRCRGEIEMQQKGLVVSDPYNTLMPPDATPQDWENGPDIVEAYELIDLGQFAKLVKQAIRQNSLQADQLTTSAQQIQQLFGTLEMVKHHNEQTRSTLRTLEQLADQLVEEQNNGG
jgi:hypothetical protein